MDKHFLIQTFFVMNEKSNVSALNWPIKDNQASKKYKTQQLFMRKQSPLWLEDQLQVHTIPAQIDVRGAN